MIRKPVITLALAGLFAGSPLAVMAGSAGMDVHRNDATAPTGINLAQSAPVVAHDLTLAATDDSSGARTKSSQQGATDNVPGAGNEGSAASDDDSDDEGASSNSSEGGADDGAGGG